MKAGILTYHRSHNYGAVLQAYALKTFLESKGCQTGFVDYFPYYHSAMYSAIPFMKEKSLLSKIKHILFFLPSVYVYQLRRKKFNRFIESKLGVGPSVLYRHKDQIAELPYDIIFYGSDQIWRKANTPAYKGFNDVYFGMYPVNAKKKVAYAASMGSADLLNEDQGFFARMMNNFTAISVREEGLQQIIEKISGRKPFLVLDPVFLLDKKDWMTNFPATRRDAFIHAPYLLFYHLLPCKNAETLANRYSKTSGEKIVEVQRKAGIPDLRRRVLHTIGPNEFVSLASRANTIITTSFHGVAFALLFEKEFYALGMGAKKDRAVSLLGQLGLADRYVTNIDAVDVTKRIDYEPVKKKLAKLRKESQNFLMAALKPVN